MECKPTTVALLLRYGVVVGTSTAIRSRYASTCEARKLSTQSEAVVQGSNLVIIKCKSAVAVLMRHAAAVEDEVTDN